MYIYITPPCPSMFPQVTYRRLAQRKTEGYNGPSALTAGRDKKLKLELIREQRGEHHELLIAQRAPRSTPRTAAIFTRTRSQRWKRSRCCGRTPPASAGGDAGACCAGAAANRQRRQRRTRSWAGTSASISRTSWSALMWTRSPIRHRRGATRSSARTSSACSRCSSSRRRQARTGLASGRVFHPDARPVACGGWIALDDATVENGCLWVIPGSQTPGHHLAAPPHEDAALIAPAKLRLPYRDDDAIPVEVLPAASSSSTAICSTGRCRTGRRPAFDGLSSITI